MRVLVTGAAGYVGWAVARRLIEAGHEVTGLIRSPDRELPAGVNPLVADLLSPAPLDAPYDGVCHLAALTRVRESFEDPLRFFSTNVQGTVNLLAALDRPAAVVFGSTAAVYGTSAQQPIAESQLPSPTNPYGASKLAAEQAVRFHARTEAIGAVVLRTFNVAGSVDGRGDPDPTRLIPRTLAVAAGRLPRPEINGGRSNAFIDARDHAILRCLLEGLRVSEVTGMELSDVGPGFVLSSVIQLIPLKGARDRGVGRRIAFAPKSAKSLLAYVRVRSNHPLASRSELWLPSRGSSKPLSSRGVWAMTKRRCQQAGYATEGCFPHIFRHTASHQMKELEVPQRYPKPISDGQTTAPTTDTGLPWPKNELSPQSSDAATSSSPPHSLAQPSEALWATRRRCVGRCDRER